MLTSAGTLTIRKLIVSLFVMVDNNLLIVTFCFDLLRHLPFQVLEAAHC